jgi:hypothetical protein
MGTTDYLYTLTPQNSPLTLKASAKNAGVVYAGAYAFKMESEGGWTSAAQFSLTKCRDCPSEKEVLAILVEQAEDPDRHELRENNFRAQLKARSAKK